MKKIIISLVLISILVTLSGCSSLLPDTPVEPVVIVEPVEPVEQDEPVEQELTADELYALGNESYTDGLSRDAFNYYTAASELGSAEAYCMLAHCYEAGVGTSIDNDLAYKYYEISANAGCGCAQFRMGVYYTSDYENSYSVDLYGLGLDEEQAEKWFLLAADNSNIENDNLKRLANDALDYIYGGYPSYCDSLEEAFESFWGISASYEVNFLISSKRP